MPFLPRGFLIFFRPADYYDFTFRGILPMLTRLFLFSLILACTLSALGSDANTPPARGYLVESDGSILVGAAPSEHAPVCFLGCP